MAIQTVGIGAAPNDNTGDTPRTGIAKLNANFTDTTNAASRLVQTSATDATAGRVMTVGAFGLGSYNLPDQVELDANTITTLGWNYVSSPINGPLTSTTKFFTIPSTVGVGRGSQWAYPVNTDDIWYRTQKSSATWSAWQPVYTGANYQPEIVGGIGVSRLMKNNSGGNILSGATVAGTLINFSFFSGTSITASATTGGTGTVWKLVDPVTCATGSHSTFTRVS